MLRVYEKSIEDIFGNGKGLEEKRKGQNSNISDDAIFVWQLIASLYFFAHPLRGLNEIFDPSKATFARPRKLGLRPQTCAFAPWDASLGQDVCPKIS
jgi:hypothetical protein